MRSSSPFNQPITEVAQNLAIAPIRVLPGLSVTSSSGISTKSRPSKPHNQLLKNPKIQKKLNSYTRKSARHALSYARAVRATLLAQEDSASKEIDEMEEYLGLLRAKRDIIHIQVSEAEEQVGLVREALDSDGIAEVCLSDDEAPSSPSSLPHSSDYLCPEAWDSDSEQNTGSTSDKPGEVRNDDVNSAKGPGGGHEE